MALSTPERTNYFFGMLLDEDTLRREQDYFNGKRWLLNRLARGSGVLCGLNVVAGEGGSVIIQPGVAIDTLGREILVPDAHSLDPGQLTDDTGRPVGEPLEEGDVSICVAYKETPARLVAALKLDCDMPKGCVHGTIREEYCVLVGEAGDEPPESPGCNLPPMPLPADAVLDAELCARVRQACPDTPDVPPDECERSACVPLARVTLPAADQDAIQVCGGTPLVYSNALLHELLLCLADRVTDLAEGLVLRYIAGDNQVVPAGDRLPDPVVVELVDRAGSGIEGVVVEFEVTRGGGSLLPVSGGGIRAAGERHFRPRENRTVLTESNGDGRASVYWQLGRQRGAQELTARAVGTPFTVTFRATATKS